MYSMHCTEIPVKSPMSKMYSMDSSVKADNMSQTPPPRKETMFQSMFNALNAIWEHVSKIPASFVANANNPLSVTLVQNEGIISHEFFKSLTTRKEPLVTGNTYVQDRHRPETLDLMENINALDKKGYENSIISGHTMYDNFQFDASFTNKDSKIINRSELQEWNLKTYIGDTIGEEKLRVTVSRNCSVLHDIAEKANTPEVLEKWSSNVPEVSYKEMRVQNVPENFNSIDIMASQEISTIATDNCDKIAQVTAKSASPYLNIGMEFVPIRSFYPIQRPTEKMWSLELTAVHSVSPKHRKKMNTVTKTRRRGRARSQLRRSGVSQTRHRKERIKHDLETEIQDDLQSYQEFGVNDFTEQSRRMESIPDDDEGVDVPDCVLSLLEERHSPPVFTLADIEPKRCKEKTQKGSNPESLQFHTRVRFVPDCQVDLTHNYENEKFDSECSKFRSRLVSESSIDSEDSYCIVFEAGSEVDFKIDSDLDEESDELYATDYEDEDEDDDDEEEEDEDEDEDDYDHDDKDRKSMSTVQKVKFNLKPIIHKMVQWDYAYRAARRGPWEEMARDRERFRGRIHCIEHVLNPILNIQHRSHIWQERFAFGE